MRSRCACGLLAVLVCWQLNQTLRAQTPPPAGPRLARLVRSLGADEYEERSAAMRELAKLGPAGRQQLEVASRSDDAEVRLRAKDLLLRLRIEDLWAGSSVGLDRRSQPASELLALLSKQCKVHLLLGDDYGAFHDQPVDLDLAHSTFWPSLDAICRSSGNHVRAHYDTRQPGLVVVSGPLGKYPTAYAGPLRVQITSAKRVFSEDLDYEAMQSDQNHTFQFNLQAMWEDGFRLVAYRPEPTLVEAVAAGHVRVAPAPTSMSSWMMLNSSSRQLTSLIRLQPPPIASKTLEKLRLKWGMIVVGEMAEMVIPDLGSTAPHFQDDLEVVVEHCTPQMDGHFELALSILRDLAEPEPRDVLLQECDVTLLDAQGRALRAVGQNSKTTKDGAELVITFIGETGDSQPSQLRLSYPRLRAQRELEIEFHDVPLPVGKPE